MKRSLLLLGIPLLVSSMAFPARAETLRPFERIGRVGHGAPPIETTAPAPRLNAVPLVAVDDSWAGHLAGTIETVGMSSFTFGTDAFATVQAGIDAVDAAGTVIVLPGTYSETASGRTLYDSSGPYTFGVFVGIARSGVTVQGVDGGGNPITSSGGVAATINTNATNGFGPSAFFIEGDDVTIAGVRIGTNSAGQNKTIEVIGDNFTLNDCDVADIYGSVYVNDWRFNVGLDTSHVQKYHVTDCLFASGCSIDLASGAGYSGSLANRVISGNSFTNSPGDYWPMISFTGSGSGVPWFVYSVGGAVITGNTFANADPAGQDIRARGTYDNSQFNWADYWNLNTFDKAVVVGPAPPANLRTYTYPSGYGTFTDVRRIGSVIQPEVDHGLAGDIVLIGAGSYEEQVVVDGKNLTLDGAGVGATTVRSPLSLAVNFGADRRSVIACMNAADIRVRDMTIDGLGRGNGNYRMYGVGFWESGGKILSCRVTGIRETPLSGSQQGVGIAAFNTTGGPFALEVGNCVLDDYQKNGMALSGAGMTVNVHDCTCTGSGNLAFQAQNGIQVSFGAAGSVTACRVSDMRYTPATAVASGIIIYQPGGPVSVSGLTGANAIDEVQAPVSWYDGSGSLNGIEVTGSLTAGQDFGPIFIGNFTSLLASRGESGRPAAQPVSEEGSSGQQPEIQSPASTAYAVTVSNSCLTGSDVAGTVGVHAYSAGGPLGVSVTNSVVADWDEGIYVDGAAVTVTANQNDISSNLTAGYDNTAGGSPQNAELNWWGALNGPSGFGPGSGDAILPIVLAGVDFTSWLSNSNDSNPGCTFAPVSDNVIAPVPPAITCLNTCVTIPVTISRTDAIPMRGYSVKVTLSPELVLCSGVASITQGTYLTGVTNFQVLDNGGGVYTVDCAILGASSCVIAPTGTLFNVAVKRTVPTGAGTVTVTPLKARDCANGPINVSPGAPATVTVDTSGPVAVANLSATQLTAGNDADGTTKIQLTFTAPGDAATVEVYRAGFGHYPEYDDAGGAAPTAPSYPPGPPWVLAAGVTASGQSDEVGTRDFWYYVVFTKDVCGNVSPVSNRTSGTLNYHLGDTHDGVTNCAGDNLVNTADISFLGGHYGIGLPLNSPFNCLDVGPTTDFSVNARPTTDNVVDFEDLIMFAINYGVVSKPVGPAGSESAGSDELALRVPRLPARGELFEVPLQMTGAGDIQGLSIELAWNPLVVQPTAVDAGELLARQGQGATVLSSRPGNVDVALLGVGQGIVGQGELARVAFRVVGDGDPGVALKQVRARDSRNRVVNIGQRNEPIGGAQRPVINYLGANYPNPFMQSTVIPFGLKATAQARLAIFDVQGRLVRNLLDGEAAAGERVATWDGRDDSGAAAPSGFYLVRLEVGDQVLTRSLKLVK